MILLFLKTLTFRINLRVLKKTRDFAKHRFFYSLWCLEKFKKYENTTLAIERVQVYCLKKKNVHADMLCGVRGKIGRWQKICWVLIFERKVKVRGCIVYCIGYLKHVKKISSVYNCTLYSEYTVLYLLIPKIKSYSKQQWHEKFKTQIWGREDTSL